MALHEGEPADVLRGPGARGDEGRRDARRITKEWLSDKTNVGTVPLSSSVTRGAARRTGRRRATAGRPRLPDGRSRRRRSWVRCAAEGARGVPIAVVSTVVVLGADRLRVLHSTDWPAFKQAFFDARCSRTRSRTSCARSGSNIEYFLIAEVFILAFALLLAVIVASPARCSSRSGSIATIYTDLFRGIPTILVIYLLGFGIPALQIPGLPNSAVFWAIVALILSYSAYVAEVYRAGIESVHPSQAAAARSLGLAGGRRCASSWSRRRSGA